MGAAAWGDPGIPASALAQRTARNGRGKEGADSTSVGMKNVYMEANTPDTPLTALGPVGVEIFQLPCSLTFADAPIEQHFLIPISAHSR